MLLSRAVGGYFLFLSVPREHAGKLSRDGCPCLQLSRSWVCCHWPGLTQWELAGLFRAEAGELGAAGYVLVLFSQLFGEARREVEGG
jgi:hypothetical protein